MRLCHLPHSSRMWQVIICYWYSLGSVLTPHLTTSLMLCQSVQLEQCCGASSVHTLGVFSHGFDLFYQLGAIWNEQRNVPCEAKMRPRSVLASLAGPKDSIGRDDLRIC